MNVLIGVCGIGFGHTTRQIEVAKELVKRNHRVKIFTFSDAREHFVKEGFDVSEVWVPWISFKGDKLNYRDLILKNYNSLFKGLFLYKRNLQNLIKDNFIPDICISDYEPNVAKIAYKFKKPLINIDQQSKFWLLDYPEINGFSSIEEKKRLNLFFPRYDQKIISSFYKLPDIKMENITVIGPIIRGDLKELALKNEFKEIDQVVIYLSQYGAFSISDNFGGLVKILEKFKEINFVIYSNSFHLSGKLGDNIIIKRVDRKEFIKDISMSRGVISTAGYTLITECLFMNKPMYLIPLPTFDQHYCAKFIYENSFGYSSSTLDCSEIRDFLEKIDHYKNNIIIGKGIHGKLFDMPNVLDKIVEVIEGCSNG